MSAHAGATPPRLLTIAGSDSGGGAGIQADLKTFAALGGHGMSAITAITAQNTVQVTAVEEVSPSVVAAQIDAVFGDLGVDAVKIGMLANARLVATVAARLRSWREQGQAPPVVLDPVMVAKSGDALLAPAAVAALASELVPLATVVTPNLPEAAALSALPVASLDERETAARALVARAVEHGAEAPGPAILVKGGHGEGDELVDLLLVDGEVRLFWGKRVDTRSTHGTGCTLSSAIAAGLGAGLSVETAVEAAIAYLRGAIAAAYPLGSGHGPVDHFFRQREWEA